MDYQPIIDSIRHVCEPVCIIDFAEKHTMRTGKLKSLSLCVIVTEGNTRALRRRLHLALLLDCPLTLSVYTTDEWAELLQDDTSYAAWIAQKGQVLYGET